MQKKIKPWFCFFLPYRGCYAGPGIVTAQEPAYESKTAMTVGYCAQVCTLMFLGHCLFFIRCVNKSASMNLKRMDTCAPLLYIAEEIYYVPFDLWGT